MGSTSINSYPFPLLDMCWRESRAETTGTSTTKEGGSNIIKGDEPNSELLLDVCDGSIRGRGCNEHSC